MKYIESQPEALLADFVECLWVVRDERSQRERTPQRILPDGCPEWIIHTGDAFERWIGSRWVRQPKSFLAGTLSRPWLVRGGSRVRTLGIRFRPGAAAVLLDVDLSGTADREIDLLPILGQAAAEMAEAVSHARTTKQMLSAAHRGLMRIATGRLHQVPRTRDAVRRLRSSEGTTRVEVLAGSLGVSRRTLERSFRSELGISPKRYARIVRLNAVLASLAAEARTEAIDLAVGAGYFDQAHLLRDFRSLTGGRLRGQREADGDMARHFTRPERLLALLRDW